MDLRKSSGSGKWEINFNLNLSLPRHPVRWFALVLQAIYFTLFGVYHLFFLQVEGALYLPLVLLTIYVWKRQKELGGSLRRVLYWYFFSIWFFLLIVGYSCIYPRFEASTTLGMFFKSLSILELFPVLLSPLLTLLWGVLLIRAYIHSHRLPSSSDSDKSGSKGSLKRSKQE
jgi:hypothetical protein